MNGELRIGLFTKRAVQVNEELTFDYQFQTFGKKRHKCYCGSEKCRGYLGSGGGGTNSNAGGGGTASNPTLDYIWEEDSSSGSDEDEEEEEEDVDEDQDESDENANEEEEEEQEDENGSKSDRVDKRHNKDNNSKDFDVNHLFSSSSLKIYNFEKAS